MINQNSYNDQEILSYFTRPTRTLNHRLVGEIRTEKKHMSVKSATGKELRRFLSVWPEIDRKTGLHLKGDELLIKAREAMISAVRIFNSAGLTFRSELFIVTAIIAWTYLCHARLKNLGISYTYPPQKNGEVRNWEVEKCLDSQQLSIKQDIIQNLKVLIRIRHEIEHRSTSQVDEALFPFLQACCFNFNEIISKWFGPKFGIEETLPIALQMATFGGDQISYLKKGSSTPTNIAQILQKLERPLSTDITNSPQFKMKIAILPVAANRPSAGHITIEIEKAAEGSSEVGKPVVFKEIQKARYTERDIVEKMAGLGFKKFTTSKHRALWRGMNAKAKGKGFGQAGDYKGSWIWFETWITLVEKHCRENESQLR